MMFSHKYVQKTPHFSMSESTLTGSLVHSALEEFYAVESYWKEGTLAQVFEDGALSIIQKVLVPDASMKEVEQLYKSLTKTAELTAILYERASEGYTGKDAIRKADKSVASNPTMTSAWKKAANEIGMSQYEQAARQLLSNLRPSLGMIDTIEAYADAVRIVNNYVHPSSITAIKEIEMPISHFNRQTEELINPVLLPPKYGGNDGIYLNAYIDLVCEIDGKLALVDHKTSSKPVTEYMVAHNEQLATYVYAYGQLTGTIPAYIAINELRTGRLVVAEVIPEILKQAFLSLVKSHYGIVSCRELNHYSKHAPQDSYSTCLNSFGKPCPFLEHCHPLAFIGSQT